MNYVDQPGTGILLRVFSGFLIAGMYVSVKAVSGSVPLGEIVFFRAFFALIPLLVFLWWRNEFPHGMATQRPYGHLLRSVFAVLSLFTSFAALARLSVAEAVLLAQLSPMLTAIAAVVFLSERLTPWRVLGLILGFAGVLLLVWPDLGDAAIERRRVVGVALGVLSAALSALSLIMIRSLVRSESPAAIALYFVIASMACALLSLPFGWVVPQGTNLLLLIASGLFGGLAHIAMTLSFRYAEASRLAPFEYLALLWPLLADLLIFRLPLSASFVLAAPLVLAGAAVAAMERQRRDTTAAR